VVQSRADREPNVPNPTNMHLVHTHPESGGYSLYGRLVLASGRANPGLADDIACAIGCDLLPVSIYQFANQNTFVRLGRSVRGSDVFWIQPTCPPTNDTLMELLIAIDTLRRD